MGRGSIARDAARAEWRRENNYLDKKRLPGEPRYRRYRAELKEEKDKLAQRKFLWKKLDNPEVKLQRAISKNGKLHWWAPELKKRKRGGL